jgi:hypothetical protein
MKSALVQLLVKSIPMLEELLKPMLDRPGAIVLALNIFAKIATNSETNKLAIVQHYKHLSLKLLQSLVLQIVLKS